MTKNKIQRLLAILCAVAAAFCMVLGFINMPKQNGAAGQEILRTMRIQTLLSATGDSVVESYVAIAKQEAQAAAKASGGGIGRFVNVHFDDFDLVAHGFADFFQNRTELAAGAAPFRPKINQNQTFAV